MVHIAADLPQFLQRRELAAYEQRLARTGYAYGVDLRRAAWLAGSMLGDPLMRSVDRRWSRTVQALEDEAVLPQRKAPPLPLLEELATLITMLRAPLPTVRMLRPEVAGQWPAITPLSTTKGAIHWLVIDRDRLMAMPDDERSFVLASALGHLQCEHGPIFAAHLMGHLGGGLRSVRTLMRAWARVAVFSADRAGLLAVRSLDAALRAVEHDVKRRWADLHGRMVAGVEADTHSVGCTLEQLARLMREIGCYSALNLDGGGSSTMRTQPPCTQRLSPMRYHVAPSACCSS